MLNIGVLEDEADQRIELTRFLARYKETHEGFSYRLEVFESGKQLMTGYHEGIDLLFMDIRLPDMLGIDVAREIRKTDETVMIVFVTNLSQYAIDGYSVNAFDYILKPLLYSAFEAKLDRIRNILSRNKTKNILTLRTKQETFHLPVDTIVFVEISGHDLLFHTVRRDYCAWGTLAKYEEELPGALFSRCNACYLVNLKYVISMRGGFVNVNGTELAVSRTRKKAFLGDLAKYKGGSV